MLNLDFSNVQSREPLNPGFYVVKIEDAEEKTSSNGNPMIAITYTVLYAADSGTPVQGTYKLWDNLVLTDKALWKVKELFTALGIDTENIVTMDVRDMIGMDLRVKVIQEMYNGENRNYVRGYAPFGA